MMEDPELLYGPLENFYKAYEKFNNRMWADKLGLDKFNEKDEGLVKDLISNLCLVETDMTIFFRLLSDIGKPDISQLSNAFYYPDSIPHEKWNEWLAKWWKRVNSKPNIKKMNGANPKYVLRNWMAQLAIDAAEKEDYSVAEELYELLKRPYDEQTEFEEKWFVKRPDWAKNRVGCSMLSCSS